MSKLRLTVTGELCPTGTYNPTILRPGYENPRMFLTNNHVKAETGAMPRGELQSVLVKLVYFPSCLVKPLLFLFPTYLKPKTN